jgi:hypothetical protein
MPMLTCPAMSIPIPLLTREKKYRRYLEKWKGVTVPVFTKENMKEQSQFHQQLNNFFFAFYCRCSAPVLSSSIMEDEWLIKASSILTVHVIRTNVPGYCKACNCFYEPEFLISQSYAKSRYGSKSNPNIKNMTQKGDL